MLFDVEDLRDWVGKDVVDLDGSSIGDLESVYFDTARDVPTFAAIKVGMLGRARLVFAPLDDVKLSPKRLRLKFDKKLVKAAPSIDLDGQLEIDKEAEIFAHYDLEYNLGASGERRLGRR